MPKKTMLILSVAGIGNTILQSPFVDCVLSSELFDVDLLFGDDGMKAVFEYDRRISKKYLLPRSQAGRMRLLLALRRNQYDVSVACFPSNRFEYNLLPFLVGARRRIIHSYRVSRLRTLSFLSNEFIEVDKHLHDVDQNLTLLRALKIDPPSENADPKFFLSPEDEAFAGEFVRGFDGRSIVGMHPTGTRFLTHKDWPEERFRELAERLTHRYNVILFGTEEDLAPFNSMDRIFLCHTTLNHAAAVVKRCEVFVSVDTGLMHLAAALGVKQVVLWGPTRFSRTRPRNHKALILGRTDMEILKYPFEDIRARFHYPHPEEIMSSITVQDVYEKIVVAVHSNAIDVWHQGSLQS